VAGYAAQTADLQRILEKQEAAREQLLLLQRTVDDGKDAAYAQLVAQHEEALAEKDAAYTQLVAQHEEALAEKDAACQEVLAQYEQVGAWKQAISNLHSRRKMHVCSTDADPSLLSVCLFAVLYPPKRF